MKKILNNPTDFVNEMLDGLLMAHPDMLTHAGDDLQYIRVNGTVVGGLAGGALYGLQLLLRLW